VVILGVEMPEQDFDERDRDMRSEGGLPCFNLAEFNRAEPHSACGDLFRRQELWAPRRLAHQPETLRGDLKGGSLGGAASDCGGSLDEPERRRGVTAD
jgi:hypothetical protein